MASEVQITLSTNGPTLSRTGLHDFSITLRATSDTNKAISADTFHTLLHPDMYVFGYQGYTFTDVESRVRIARPHVDVCYFQHYPRLVKIPARGAWAPYSVTHTIKLPDQQAMRDMHTEIEAELDPSQEPEKFADRIFGTTADFQVGHSYEIGLGDRWNELYSWKVCPSWSWLGWWGGNEKVSDRVAGHLPMVLMNKVIIKVVE